MAEWRQLSAGLTCKAESLSLRASLLPTALPWKESLWDDFCTLFAEVALSPAPGRGIGPRPNSALEPGLRKPNSAPLRCEVGKWAPQQCGQSRCTLAKHAPTPHQHTTPSCFHPPIPAPSYPSEAFTTRNFLHLLRHLSCPPPAASERCPPLPETSQSPTLTLS